MSSTLTSPSLRITGARYLLRKRRAVHPEASATVLDELLLQLAALTAPKSEPITPTLIAALVERSAQVGYDAARRAELAQADRVCTCGHEWNQHLTGRGCLECAGCTSRRPHAVELTPAGGE